jgi:hypothetical protein
MKAPVKSRIAHTKFALAQIKPVFAQAKSRIAQANALKLPDLVNEPPRNPDDGGRLHSMVTRRDLMVVG